MNGGPPSPPVRAFVLRPSYLTQNLEIRGSNPVLVKKLKLHKRLFDYVEKTQPFTHYLEIGGQTLARKY